MQEDGSLASPPAAAGAMSGLGLRVVSGLAFAAVALAFTWAGLLPFAVLVLVVSLAMSWEWTQVVRGPGIDLTLIVQGLSVTLAVLLAAFGYVAVGLLLLMIGTIVVFALEFGERSILSASGVLYSGLPALALLWLRGDEPNGFAVVLFIALVVAATDTAAFFAGRLIGGPRLAPRISPKKTWSGLIGGLTAAGLTAAGFALALGGPVAALAVTGVLMGVVAQAGDLAESALKRAFDVKDASQLLPGHGGFMDRMDGIVSVSVLLALAALFLAPHTPGRAILSGLMPL